MADDSTTVNLSVKLGFFGTLELNYPSRYEAELSSLLDAASLEHEPVLSHSDLQDVFIEAIKVLGPGGGAAALSVALNAFVKTIAHRNDGKKVVLDGQEISGFSNTKIDKILRDHAKRLEERDANVEPDEHAD